MNRRGVFFTIIAVLLVGFAIVTFLSLRKDTPIEQAVLTRVQTLDNFLTDSEKDFDRALYISLFRAILAVEQDIISEGYFVDDAESVLAAALRNGTYGNLSLILVDNATLEDWQSRIQAQSSRIGADFNVTIRTLRVMQSSPWAVDANVNITLIVRDTSGAASFTHNHSATASVGITGFEDPTFLLNTLGRVTRIINQTPYSTFVTGNDTANLMAHMGREFYFAHNDSPSFLQRLEGNLSASPYGIESLVNLSKISAQDVPIETRTAVDYLYFGSGSVTDYCISGMPGWFRIDSDHLTTYQVSGITC